MKTFIPICSALIVAIALFRRAMHADSAPILVLAIGFGAIFLLYSVYMCTERWIKHTGWHVALERWYVNNSEQIVYSVFIVGLLLGEVVFCWYVPQGTAMDYLLIVMRIFFGFGLVVMVAALVRSLRSR